MIFNLLFLLTAFFGIIFSFSTRAFTLSDRNWLVDWACPIQTTQSCWKVSRFKVPLINRQISLSSLAIFYFLFQFNCFLIGYLSGSPKASLVMLNGLSVLSCLLTLLLIIWQGVSNTGWCRLCLVISILVIGQAFLLATFTELNPELYRASYLIDSAKEFHGLSASICFTILIYIIVDRILKRQESIKLLKEWSEFLNRHKVVTHKKSGSKIEIWDNDIVIGHRQASLKIVMLINPYCESCAVHFNKIAQLFSKYSENVCVVVRFTVDDSINELTTKTTHQIIQVLSAVDSNTRIEVLIEWFKLPVINLLKNKYPSICGDHSGLLNRYDSWIKENNFKFAPVILVNGKLLQEVM